MSMKPKKDADKTPPPAVTATAAKQLAAFVERLERLDAEKAAIAADRREVLKEAAALGFDAREIDAIVALRRKDPDNTKIEQSLRDVYLNALALDLGELGKWARAREMAESRARTAGVVATMSAKSAQVVDAYTVVHDLPGADAARERLAEGVQ